MTDNTPEINRNNLLKGLAYLRRHTLEAHHAGDGLQVLHHVSIALQKCEDFGKTYPEDKIQMREIRWAFILGMYWFVYDNLRYELESSFEYIDSEGESKTDKHLIVSMFNHVTNPQQRVDLKDILEIPLKWWNERGGSNSNTDEEDLISLSFLIELVWYSNPEGDDWSQLLTNWLNQCPEKNALRDNLEQIKSRLEFQTGFYTGAAFQVCNPENLPITEPIQRKLFQGWIAYYNCEWGQVDEILNRLKHKVKVEDPAYVPLFYLFNVSRTHRKGAEDQFISLSRFHLARTQQTAQTFQYLRDSYTDSQFFKVVTEGYSRNSSGNERVSTLRMAMLVSLQGLRSWDVGTWLIGMTRRAKSHLELGALGNVHLAVVGILDAVRAHEVPDPKKSPHFEKCLLQLDALDVDSRRSFTESLLSTPPCEWRYAYSILCELSDAIPEETLPNLAEWSLKVEQTDLLKNLWIHTLLGVWNRILSIAANKTELIDILNPVLQSTIKQPSNWEGLHDTYIAAISFGSPNIAKKLCELLVATECTMDHCNQYRFSIAFNVLKNRPELINSMISFLEEYTNTRDNLYQSQLVNRFKLGVTEKQKFNDSGFRKTVIKQLTDRIETRQNMTGPSISISGSFFYKLAELVSWPRSEEKLVELVCEAIDSETVLYHDKPDYIAFLGILVKLGPQNQARLIANHAIHWLTGGIQGRSLGGDMGGPLSNFQIYTTGSQDLFIPLFYLIEQCIYKCPDEVSETLFEWLPLNTSVFLPRFSTEILRIELNLIFVTNRNSDQKAAILVGLSEALAQISISDKANQVLHSFEDIILKTNIEKLVSAITLKKEWGLSLLVQWKNRLVLLSRHPSPEVRESVAVCINRWTTSELPPDIELSKVRDDLSKDCRLRVRKAVIPDLE